MEISKTKTGEKLTLAVTGRVDTTTAPQLDAAVNADIDGVTELEFDLSKLEYISSAGLRVILSAQKKMSKQGKMYVSHITDEVRDIFETTGFSDILTIVD